MNRFKGLDLTDKSTWRTTDGDSYHCTGGGDPNYPQEKELLEGKVVAWGSLTNSLEKKK